MRSPRPALDVRRLPLVGVAVLALGACELGEPEPEAEARERPKVRKLYAPGAEPGTSPEADPPSAAPPSAKEQEMLQAALLGTDDEEQVESEEAARERRAPRRRPARRRPAPRERAAADPEPLIEEDVPAGALSDGAFQSAITDWSGMKRCLASNARRLPTRSGALRVAFTIRGDGQVKRSRVVETSNEVARAIAPCVERRARRIRFPAFAAASDETEKTAKFVF